MAARRAALVPDQRVRAAAAATARLVALPEMREAVARGGTVAGFVATRAEIDPAFALDRARASGARVVLPRLSDGVPGEGAVPGEVPGAEAADPVGRAGRDTAAGAEAGAAKELDVNDVNRRKPGGPRMRFHVAAPGDLRPGRFGIQEPEAARPEVRAAEVAVMIVPGLAFDASGRRLGFGGGYYDEVLAGLGGAGRPGLVVGLGYDFQVVDWCPADDQDARVDCVVTDARVIRCGGTGGDDRARASGVET